MTQHDYIPQRFGTVSDEIYPFEGRRQMAVFDEVALGQRKNEVSVRDVDLPASELLGKDAIFDALDDVFGVVGAREQDGVGHSRHRMAGEALAPAVPGRLLFEVLGAQAI